MQPEPISVSLKKMLPIWGILMLVVFISLLTIRFRAVQFLEAGVYQQEQVSAIANIHYHAGEKIWLELAEGAVDIQSDELSGKLGEFSDSQRLEEAKELFQESLKVYPELKGPHRKLAQLEYWDGNEAEAYYHLGHEFLLDKKSTKAIIHFGTAYDLEPDNLKYLVQFGNALAAQGRWDEVQEIVETAPEGILESTDGVALVARNHLVNRRFNKGLALLDKLIEMDAGNERSIDLFINAYQDRNDDAEKLKYLLDQMIEASAVSARSYHRLAVDLTRSENYDSALKAINQALNLQPNNALLLVDKALILKQLGRDFEAQRTYDRALEINFDFVTELIKSQIYRPLDDL